MATKFIHNPGPNILFVGSTMIAPGDGRDIDTMFLPPEHQDAPEPAPEQKPSTLHDDVAELLGEKVANIVATLPNISFEALDLAEQMEAEGKKRATLLAAMANERLRRASDKVDGGAGGEGGEGGDGSKGADAGAGGGAETAPGGQA